MSDVNDRQVGGEHYLTPIQHWDYVVANDIPYLEAQVIKYCTRHRRKNGLQDLEKALHFLEKAIEVEKAQVAATSSHGGSYCKYGTGVHIKGPCDC